MRVRVVTWNIHAAIGADKQCLPERIAKIIREMEADIVALQEVDGRAHLRPRRPEAFETFGRLLGGAIVEARLFGKQGQEHGNLLWSRWPITRQAVRLLPGGLEQRGLIEAEIELPKGPLRVFVTHLGLSPFTRRGQAREAAGRVRRGSGPAVMMGDFNEWTRFGAVHRRLSQVLPNALLPATFPARRPFAPLDRIYASDGVALHALTAPKEAAEASDHLPLMAELDF